jgi:hypothetical protein
VSKRRGAGIGFAMLTAIGLWAALGPSSERVPIVAEVQGIEHRDRRVSPGRRGAPLRSTEAHADEAATPLPPPREGYGLVNCDLDLVSAGTLTGSLQRDGHDDGEAILTNKRLVAQVPAGSGSARFDFEFARGSFAWEGLSAGGTGKCAQAIVDTLFTGLYGRLEGDSFPDARVTGCGSDVAIDGDEFFMTVQAPRECEVWVVVMTDTETAEGPAVSARTIPGVDSEVVLTYPPASALRPFSPELLEQRREFAESISSRFSPDTAPTPESPSPSRARK